MKIQEIIRQVKKYSRGLQRNGQPIDEKSTRDQVLYGNTDTICTGIVTTCFASVDIIEKTHAIGANFIICHEALFWNHGDHTDWLEAENNAVYFHKKELLDEYQITVWRDHDYIHSGIPDGKGGWYDGIFKGFLYDTGLDPYYVKEAGTAVQYSNLPIELCIPEGITVGALAQMIITGARLNGIRIIGDTTTVVKNVAIPMHCLGFCDNDTIRMIDSRKIDCLITMELIDYTVNEYMRDSMQSGDTRAILAVGHFNLEEPGMKYMLKWLPEALKDATIPIRFIQSGDMNHFIKAE